MRCFSRVTCKSYVQRAQAFESLNVYVMTRIPLLNVRTQKTDTSSRSDAESVLKLYPLA